jgi:predicted transcriptional regulator
MTGNCSHYIKTDYAPWGVFAKSEEPVAQQEGRSIATSNSSQPPKPRRTRMEIYNDILKGIEQELTRGGEVKPTRVQQRCNLAYDKFSRYLGEMASKGLIHREPISITAKGLDFLRDHRRISRFVHEIGMKYLDYKESRLSESDYGPIKFLDNLPPKSHSVLLYDDKKYAELVTSYYIAKGLERGESCVYLTFEDPRKIERRLSRRGINAESFKQRNLLRVHTIKHSDVSEGNPYDNLKKVIRESTIGLKPPYRFYRNFVPIEKSVKGMKLELLYEQLLHENFKTLDLSLMCRHDLSEIEKSARTDFVETLLKNHHQVIYASEPEKAIAFDPTLLESEE